MTIAKRSGLRGVWPVVQRELRESSRRPFNHWLRVASALGGMGLLALILVLDQNATESVIGTELFYSLHALLLTLICCFVPMMTGDCIAREKRDGTLGLLFLTGLTPAGIVIGKSLVQAFRAFTLWVAVLPILTIPFLTGGIVWQTALSVVSMEFCAAVLCLSAGLLASTMAKSRALAIALGLIFSFAFVGLFGLFITFYFSVDTLRAIFLRGYYQNGNNTYLLVSSGGPMRLAARFFFARAMLPPAAALAIFMIVIRIAARRVDHSWKDQPPSPTKAHLVRRYCTPLFKNWMSRSMHRALDRNPIVWLQQYSWKARLSKWGLCLVFVLLECGLVGNAGLEGLRYLQGFLTAVLAAVFTFVGVNSFLEEKKTGALELILISPLSVNQIIWGRVWGLWKQFFPAMLLILFAYLALLDRNLWYGNAYWTQRYDRFQLLWIVLGGYFAMPIFTTYFALRVRNLIVGAILTWVGLVLAPAMGIGFLDELSWHFNFLQSPTVFHVGIVLGNVAFAGVICFLLRHSLTRRIYSF